jgi:hypothetical protein
MRIARRPFLASLLALFAPAPARVVVDPTPRAPVELAHALGGYVPGKLRGVLYVPGMPIRLNLERYADDDIYFRSRIST